MKQRQESLSKITRPIFLDVLQRKRLFRLLDSCLKRPVIWVSGPGGAGKTTLITTYLESRNLPCLWYSVDAQDADPATFFFYTGLALHEKKPNRKKRLPLLTPEYLPGITTFTRRYFRELFENLPTPFVIVFDNYQNVSPHASFHVIISEALALMPKGINIIAISRNYPPPVLMPREDTDNFSFIEWNDLRFSFHEAKDFIEGKAEKALNTETLSLLYSKTDGWVAGLLLIMESLRGHALDYGELEKLPIDDVFNYFADEILSREDNDTLEFLLKTAFVPGITSDMAERLTGNKSSELILSRLTRNNFFAEKTSQIASTYHYHPLFREFLVSKAIKTFSSEEVSTIRREAARLLEGTKRVEDAAALFIEASDWNSFIKFIIEQAPVMTQQGRYIILLDWMAAIPSGMFDLSPWLLYWRGVCATPFDPTKAEFSLRRALDIFSNQSDRTGMFMSLCGMQDLILNMGAFQLFDEWISLMDKALAEDASFPSPEIEQRVIMNMISALTCSQPHHPDLTLWTDRGFVLLDAKDVPLPIRFCIAVHLNIYYLWIGDFRRATHAITLLRHAVLSADIPELFAVWHKVQEALYGLFMSSPEDCTARVTEGLAFTKKCGIPMWDNHMILCGMFAAVRAGDSKTFDSFKSHLFMEKATVLDVVFHHAVLAIESFRNNELAAACNHLKACIKKQANSGFRMSIPLFYLILVDMLIAMGNISESLKWLSEAREYANAIKSSFFQYYCDLFETHIAFLEGREAEALRRLLLAFTLGRDNGYKHSLWLVPHFLVDLCIRALEHDIETGYARSLIGAHRLAHASPPVYVENWPWRLKIFTLGRFEILSGDKPLAFSGKTQKKPLQMLKVVVALGGKGVPEGEISDVLWPEADGDMAHRSFETTLYRLRKLIDDERVILLQDGQLSLDARYCWIDTWAFEDVVARAETSWRDKDTEKAARLSERAMETYKGHFLPADSREPWTVSLRDRLRKKFLRLVTKTGQYWEDGGDYEKALEHFEKALEIDEHAEELYQHVIKCYCLLGQQAKATELYKRCVSMLSEVFGIRPSSKTEEIYKSLCL